MRPRIYMVDVFADRPYTGNPLAVVIGAKGWTDEQMQQFAAEINFSDTTFVAPLPEPDGGYRTRLFSPAREVAFGGHPIIGTAWIVRQHMMTVRSGDVRLNLAVGQVPVTFESSADGEEAAWFHAPPIMLGVTCPREEIARAVGLSVEEIDGRTPVQQVSAGTSAIVVPLKSLDSLRRCRFDLGAFAGLAAEGFPPLLYLFCRETHDARNDLCARFFFEAHGVREDPATGNGASFLGAYLLEHRCFPTLDLSLRIEQGYEMRRPSLVMLRARMLDGRREVRVGGQVIQTMEGEVSSYWTLN